MMLISKFGKIILYALIMSSCNVIHKNKIVYEFNDQTFKEESFAEIDFIFKRIGIYSNDLSLSVGYEEIEDLKNHFIFDIQYPKNKDLHFVVKKKGLTWSIDKCNFRSGHIEVRRLNLQRKEISGIFEFKVCPIKNSNQVDVISGSFKGLRLKILDYSNFWRRVQD